VMLQSYATRYKDTIYAEWAKARIEELNKISSSLMRAAIQRSQRAPEVHAVSLPSPSKAVS
jgi:hypothetical protein